jgi:hypothetical protein
MQRQTIPVDVETIPDDGKRPQRPDEHTNERAEKSPYSHEVEDYTDETVQTPKDRQREKGGSSPGPRRA